MTRKMQKILAVMLVLSTFVAGQEKAREINYARDVEPIFKANCVACHRHDERMGGLSLETYDEMMKGGAHGHAVMAGDAAASRLVQMVDGKIEPRMPLGGKLKPEEIATIKAWVEAGGTNSSS